MRTESETRELKRSTSELKEDVVSAAAVLHQSKEIEKWGSGLKRISKECAANGVRVDFKVLKSGFLVTFRRNPEPGFHHSAVGKTVEKTREKIIVLLGRNPNATRVKIAKSTGLSIRGVEWNLSALKKRGILKRVGAAKGGHWKIIK